MSAETLGEVLATLSARGLDTAEVYWKRGRSRRYELENGDGRWSNAQEEGWAVRAGDRRGAFFVAGTGEPRSDYGWPEPASGALRLPEPGSAGADEPESEPEAPLLGESEARALLDSVARDLAAELPGAKLSRASLEEGTSESELRNSRGIDARWRGRAAILRLEATAAAGAEAVAVDLSERQATAFRPASVARRLADRLLVAQSGAAPERDRGEFLLSPAVGARLLAGLLPLLVGGRAEARSNALRDRRGRIGAPVLTVVDDGRLRDGGLAAAFDGEGVATREVVLIEDGVYRQPLVSWREARPPALRASGCTRRASWRDVPVAGPTHLYVRPQPQTSVAALLGAVARGYYLLDATGPGRFDCEGDRFALPVCGFAVVAGRASAPVAKAWLCGSLGGFLRGLDGVARDLVFLPLDGLLGSPTLLATGLEIRPAPSF
jgi:PmbA protein